MLSWWIILLFVPVGIVAGILGTVVGIASLASYPALLAAGLPPVVANVTNLTSQFFIGAGAIPSSLKDIKGYGKRTSIYFILILLGALLGSYIVSIESSASFAKIVPFFILIATGLILKPQRKRVHHYSKRTQRWLTGLSYFAIFLMGMYCGYFGAASGIIFLALLSATNHCSFRVYNGIRNVAVFGASIASVVMFILRVHIDWGLVVPLAIGMLIGGYVGPIIVRYLNAKYLKRFIACCSFCLSIYLFIKAY